LESTIPPIVKVRIERKPWVLAVFGRLHPTKGFPYVSLLALAGVAVAVDIPKNGGPVENARVAITAVNPAPLLVKGAESALVGKQIDEHVASLVGELAAKMAKPLTTSALTPEYRREIVRVYAKRAVLSLQSRA